VKRIGTKGILQFFKYGLMGSISVAVNLAMFYILLLIGVNYLLSNVVSYFVATLVFFLLNKIYVYQQRDNIRLRLLFKEFSLFFATRIGTTVIESLLLFICVDIFKLHVFYSKIGISVVIIILNYILSTFFVFRQGGGG